MDRFSWNVRNRWLEQTRADWMLEVIRNLLIRDIFLYLYKVQSSSIVKPAALQCEENLGWCTLCPPVTTLCRFQCCVAAENALYRLPYRLFFWFCRFSFISFSNKTSHATLHKVYCLSFHWSCECAIYLTTKCWFVFWLLTINLNSSYK